MKSFDNASQYLNDMSCLLPGHQLVSQLVAADLALLTQSAPTIGVVGSGPGTELVALAKQLPKARFHAIEPAQAMVAS